MTIPETKDSAPNEKQAALDAVNLEYSKHAAQLGQKTWLLEKYARELEEHKAKMTDLDTQAGKIRADVQGEANA
jgi:hypothetical protein